MTIGSKRINWRLLHIKRKDTQRLNGIHEEEDTALTAEFAQCVQVMPESTGKLDRGHREHPSAQVHRSAQVVDYHTRAATRNGPHFNAPWGEIHPRILIRRVFLRRKHDIIARLPGETFRHDADAMSGVRHEVHIFWRRRIDELRGEFAHTGQSSSPLAKRGDAIRSETRRIVVQCHDRRSRQWCHGRVVEERPRRGDGKLRSESGPIHMETVRGIGIRGRGQSLSRCRLTAAIVTHSTRSYNPKLSAPRAAISCEVRTCWLNRNERPMTCGSVCSVSRCECIRGSGLVRRCSAARFFRFSASRTLLCGLGWSSYRFWFTNWGTRWRSADLARTQTLFSMRSAAWPFRRSPFPVVGDESSLRSPAP